jgi:hypothetical protein
MTKHLPCRKAIAAMTAAVTAVAMGMSFTGGARAGPDTNPAVTAATAIPPSLTLIRAKTSLLGKHYWYQQPSRACR